MSKLSVNELTDETGSGAPSFPNGMSVTGAALTDPEITGGIFLGGTGTANKLDDYEEGTWTPVYKGFITDPVVSYGANTGRYIKVGNQVILWFVIRGRFDTAGSGNLFIGGLPFSNFDEFSLSYSGFGSIGQSQDWFSSEGAPAGATVQLGKIILQTHETSDATSDKSTVVQSNFTGGDTLDNRVVGFVTYKVTS